MKTSTLIMIAVALVTAAGTPQAKVRVVASSPDLASIAEMVGGDKVEVKSIARGTQNPHYVEVLPSYMVTVKRADIYLKVGLSLDRWAQRIIDGSRNGNLVVVDCSQGITPMNVPTQKVDASMGDLHPGGNPHYWLDPDNGLIIAQTIFDALLRVDGDNTEYYTRGMEAFRRNLEAARQRWAAADKSVSGMEIVSYHDDWPYFSRAFGVTVAGWIEPLPGIEPTPSHTAQIVEMIKSRGIKVIGVEPYFSLRTPESIARQTGATVMVLPTSVGGVDEAHDYFSLFDAILDRLTRAKGE